MIWIFLIGCGQDKGLTIFNSPPQAYITSHEDGATFYEGEIVEFIGSLSDPTTYLRIFEDHGMQKIDFSAKQILPIQKETSLV